MVECLDKLPFAGLSICTTGFPKDVKSQVEAKAQALGAECSGAYNPNVCTHLVAAEVGSMKYEAAVEKRTPIVKASWITDCYLKKQRLPLTQYLLGAFSGLCITITGLHDKRKKLQKLILGQDGKYSGVLDPRETTHLVAVQPSGPKYEAARKWNIKIVLPEWIETCHRRAKWVNKEEFKLIGDQDQPEENSSNSSESKRREQLILKAKEEELRRRESEMAEKRRKQEEYEKELLSKFYEFHQDPLQTLEGFQIFLHGFGRSRLKRMAEIVTILGATLNPEWSPLATHAVIGERANEKYIRQLKSESSAMAIVTADWLVDAIRLEVMPEVENYSYNIQKVTQPSNVPVLPSGTSSKENKSAQLHSVETTTKRKLSAKSFEEHGEKRHRGPLYGKVVCVSRYGKAMRREVRQLTEKLSGTYTERLTKNNPKVDFLVSAQDEGEKCKKAHEWSIPIKDFHWLQSMDRPSL